MVRSGKGKTDSFNKVMTGQRHVLAAWLRAGLRTAVVAAIGLLWSAPAAAAIDPGEWQDLANALDDPVKTLGLGTDAGAIFANFFWAKLQPLWPGILFLAGMCLVVAGATGYLRYYPTLISRTLFVILIVTFGMLPMPHATYAGGVRVLT